MIIMMNVKTILMMTGDDNLTLSLFALFILFNSVCTHVTVTVEYHHNSDGY